MSTKALPSLLLIGLDAAGSDDLLAEAADGSLPTLAGLLAGGGSARIAGRARGAAPRGVGTRPRGK
jgi:hypothetical protein